MGGELSRLILAQAGVDYEDHRIGFDEWKSGLKDKTPFGGLPMIDYNGFELAQNLTIARYLAKKFDLAGKTPEEEALCDMIVDCTMDVINCDFKSEKFLNETLPNAIKNFAKLLDSNGGKYFEGKFEDEIGKHKCLKDHINNVMNLPNIKAWV